MDCVACGPESDLDMQVSDFVSFATENMFTIYSMNGCQYCDKVKELMALTNQQYVVYTLDQHFTIEQFEDEFGTKQFPQVVVDLKGQNDRIKIGGAVEVAQYFKENSLA